MNITKTMGMFQNLFLRAYPLREINNVPGVCAWIDVLKATKTETVRLVNPNLTSVISLTSESAYLKKFFSGSTFLMFPISFYSTVFGYGFRDVNSKYFSTYNQNKIGIYTAMRAYSENLVYNTPIVITEGVKDAEILSVYYPYVFACLTSAISKGLAEFLSIFTSRIIIVPDTDEAGQRGFERSQKNCSEFGVNINRVRINQRFKDVSDIFEDCGCKFENKELEHVGNQVISMTKSM